MSGYLTSSVSCQRQPRAGVQRLSVAPVNVHCGGTPVNDVGEELLALKYQQLAKALNAVANGLITSSLFSPALGYRFPDVGGYVLRVRARREDSAYAHLFQFCLVLLGNDAAAE